MLLKVFSVRDMKSEAFLQPFFSPSVGSALRAFGDATNEQNSPFFKHPSDYVLYEIGSFDDSNGALGSISPVKLLATAMDVKDILPVTPSVIK